MTKAGEQVGPGLQAPPSRLDSTWTGWEAPQRPGPGQGRICSDTIILHPLGVINTKSLAPLTPSCE